MRVVSEDWSEAYHGGTQRAELELFARLAHDINIIQEKNRQPGEVLRRAFHAKTVAGILDAHFRVSPSLSPDLAHGILRPGATYDAIVRFSNAAGVPGPDGRRDLRGVALRVQSEPVVQDFLLTNAPASHVRDGPQFMAAAMAGVAKSRPRALLELVRRVGLREALRILRALRQATASEVRSLATEQFWSRAPYAVGRSAVKFTLVPLEPRAVASSPSGDGYLRAELALRLREGPVRYRFAAQRYATPATTPIEDGTVEWTTPHEEVAELVIPQQELSAEADAAVEGLAFSPWNTSDGIRPIGSLNRVRKLVYEASAAARGASPASST